MRRAKGGGLEQDSGNDEDQLNQKVVRVPIESELGNASEEFDYSGDDKNPDEVSVEKREDSGSFASDSGEEESNSSDSEDAAQEELSSIPFETLEKLRGLGQRSMRVRRPAKLMKRANKNMPMEMSAKKPVSTFREIIHGASQHKKSKDPRFESLSGEYNQSRFRKQYSFLYDEHLPKNAEKIKKEIKKTSDKDQKWELRQELNDIKQQIKDEKNRRTKEKFNRELKAKELEAVKAGKKPYYLKRGEKRKMELIQKYKELKDSGQLENFMKKKRKRKASKEHKLLPNKRRTT